MSEQILKALMQLFAIIARPESNLQDRRTVVESFLKSHLNKQLLEEYLNIFDEFYSLSQEKQKEKELLHRRISSSSVRVLKICTRINEELAQPQKIIVLLQLLEFVKSDSSTISPQELEFIETVAETFNIPADEYKRMKDFISVTFDKIPNDEDILVIDEKDDNEYDKLLTKHIKSDGLSGQIWVLNIRSTNMYFIRYIGANEIYMNSQMLEREKVYAFNYGSSIRNQLIKPIYYSDIVSHLAEDRIKSRIVFKADNVNYKFHSNKVGIHDLSFTEYSGRLVGIMGSSGAGKSTLLNVLNGSVAPTSGSVTINDIDIHTEKRKIEGIIGHVSQDDLLIEELTVFQNLYYNARLCFDNYSKNQLEEVVERTLKNLGLSEIKDIQVGTPLNKKISGGQRKRLNIALELIREPAVLFLDEPTSGLSSRDSENILDLLKELSLKGKLVFVVIHQPSSEIFKMFDKLMILDSGGYLIYNGNPIDSIIYFKSKVHHANWNESECHACGNVNPEQLFNIIEAAVLNEYGKLTDNRKITPEEWNRFYLENKVDEEPVTATEEDLPEISFKIPNKLKQLWVFVSRDILKKLSDFQYLAINFLEAPVLAFILAYIIKYYSVDVANEFGYTLENNSNLPVYLFMSVIVAIFMGLTSSAEEIIKDRKILKREAFLNLSWASYLFSKVTVQFVLSAIQAATFVIVGNSILEIKGMNFYYWLVLFSAWASSNLMGLVISDSFRTVVTIYILIPFLVIPQIILSGIIVKYEKLNPDISSPESIPWYGEIITARWAYEALATYQYMENEYQRKYYYLEKLSSNASYKSDFLINDLQNKLVFVRKNLNNNTFNEKNSYNLELVRNEIKKEYEYRKILKKDLESTPLTFFDDIDKLKYDLINEEIIDSASDYLATIKNFYTQLYKFVYLKKNEVKSGEDPVAGPEIKRKYYNESLTEFVTNKNEFERIVEYNGKLIQKTDPIYLDPVHPFIKAHFYAPRKQMFGNYYYTYYINIIVIWFSTCLLFLILYFRILKRFIDFFENAELFSNKK